MRMQKIASALLAAVLSCGGLAGCADIASRIPKRSFDVVFDCGDGQEVTAEVLAGECYVLPDAPERPGYNFMGWYTGENGTGERITSETVFSDHKDVRLYAFWEVRPESAYNVVFDYGDGRELTTETAVGGCYILPDVPERPGYDFAGWYTGKNGTGEQITSETVFSEYRDVRVYAFWKVVRQEAQVRYVGFMGRDEGTQTVTLGGSYDLQRIYQTGPDSIEYLFYNVPGYDFLGWYDEPDGGRRIPYRSNRVDIGTDHALYARYEDTEPLACTIPSTAEYLAYNADAEKLVAYGRTEDGYALEVFDKNLVWEYTAWEGEGLHSFDTDGDYLVYADGSSEISVLRIGDGSLYKRVEVPGWNISTAVIDGERLGYFWGNDSAIFSVYNLETDAVTDAERPERTITDPIVALNRKDHIVYASGGDGQLVYYDLLTGRILYEEDGSSSSEIGYGYAFAARVYFDGTYLWDGYRYMIRNPRTGEQVVGPDPEDYRTDEEDEYSSVTFYAGEEDCTVVRTWANRFYEGYDAGADAYRFYDGEGVLRKTLYASYADNPTAVVGDGMFFYADGDFLTAYRYGEAF